MMFEAIAFLLMLLIIATVGWRVDILNKRVDLVHRRISLNLKAMGFNDHWDDPVPPSKWRWPWQVRQVDSRTDAHTGPIEPI